MEDPYSVGSKVVCVDDLFDITLPNFQDIFHQLPKNEVTYKVRENDGSGAIKLEEIVNPEFPFDLGAGVMWTEPAFAQVRFAPLLEDRDELSESLLEDIELDVLVNEGMQDLEIESYELAPTVY